MNRKILALLLVLAMLAAATQSFAIATDLSGEPPAVEMEPPAEPEITPSAEPDAPSESEPPAEPPVAETPDETEQPDDTENPDETEIPDEQTPGAEQPAETAPEAPGTGTPEAPDFTAALYSALMSAGSVEEVEAIVAGYTDEELAGFFLSLTDQQRTALEKHLNGLDEAPGIEPGTEPEDSSSEDDFIEHVPEIINPAMNVVNAAPLLPPQRGASGQKRGMTASGPSTASEDNALKLNKTVSEPDENGVYTLKLEAYATGEMVLVPIETAIPTDIVLVLDQSGSMSEYMSATGYRPFSGTPQELYNIRNNLYVKLDDGSYSKVTVNRRNFYDYTSRSSNTNSQNYSSRDNMYHKTSAGEFHSISISRKYRYTYDCSVRGCSWSDTSTGANTVPSFAGDLYLRSNIYEYTFTYTNENGENVSETVTGNEPAPLWPFHEYYTSIRRLDALVSAVTVFVNEVIAKAAADNVNHRIAIVGFSSSGYNNTEILTGVTITTGNIISDNNPKYYPYNQQRNGVQYGSATPAVYAAALQDMLTGEGRTSVYNAINALTAHGGTQTLDGLTMAENIFINSPLNGEQRNRVVILFTDGETNSNRDNTVAKARDLKNTHGATVYTVGIFDGADGTPPITSGTSSENRLMHLISSNYPSATGFSNYGPLNPNLNGKSYYLSAGDANALTSVFKSIADQIESGETSVTLDENAVLKDVISPYFELAGEDPIEAIQAYEVAYAGSGSWSSSPGASYTCAYDENTKTISVTGFNYKENFVWDNPEAADKFGGKKLVVEIKLRARDGFWGGNNVPTNTDASGMYENGESASPVGSFPIPLANVPLLTPTAKGADYNIYAGNPAPSHEALIGISDIPNDWRTDYVTVARVPETISNVESGTYEVTVTVKPKYGPAPVGSPAEEWSGKATATVRVFRPVVTFKDSRIEPGDTADYSKNHVSTVWKDGNTLSTDVNMTGQEPQLAFTYSPGAGAFETDTDVKVTSVSGDNGFNYTVPVITFAWEPDSSVCGDASGPENAHFRVHVTIPNLVITKKVTSGLKNGRPAQSFIFEIRGENGFFMTVVLSPEDFTDGEASITIYGISPGSYTVAEREDWSWQYNLTSGNGVTVSHGGTASFANKRKNINWLGDSAIVSNVFSKKGREDGTE